MPSKQTGLSLVELMVALVIGLIVLGGVVHMFFHSRQIYAELNNVSQLQENIGFISDHLRVELRNADDISWNNDTLEITRERNSSCDGSSNNTNQYRIGGTGASSLLCNGQPMLGGAEAFKVTSLNCETLEPQGLSCSDSSATGLQLTITIDLDTGTTQVPITVALRNRILPLLSEAGANEN